MFILQDVSSLKRLNKAKRQPGQSPRFALFAEHGWFRYGHRGARTQDVSPLKRLNKGKLQPGLSPDLPCCGARRFRYGHRVARTQALSPLKRLNMTKPQPGQSPRFALRRNTAGLGMGTGCSYSGVSLVKRLNMAKPLQKTKLPDWLEPNQAMCGGRIGAGLSSGIRWGLSLHFQADSTIAFMSSYMGFQPRTFSCR